MLLVAALGCNIPKGQFRTCEDALSLPGPPHHFCSVPGNLSSVPYVLCFMSAICIELCMLAVDGGIGVKDGSAPVDIWVLLPIHWR